MARSGNINILWMIDEDEDLPIAPPKVIIFKVRFQKIPNIDLKTEDSRKFPTSARRPKREKIFRPHPGE